MANATAYRYAAGRIVVFAKAPQAGQVKTRLAADIGEQAAVALYRQWVQDTVATVVQAKLAPVTLYANSQHPLFDALKNEQGIGIRMQAGADLGLRMHNAIQSELEQAEFVVLIGTDCPVMTAGYLDQACRELCAGTEFVFGPAEDGGYVLIGARSAEKELFTDMCWSTRQVMQQTRERLRQLNRQHAELETLWDLDTLADLERWQTVSRSAANG